MKLWSVLAVALISFSSVFSHAAFDCEYTINYDIIKGQEPEISRILENKLKNCEGKNPCETPKSRVTVDTLSMASIKYELDSSKKFCLKEAAKSCPVLDHGILNSKKISVKFKGQDLKTLVCKASPKKGKTH
jgi:hypothetical protein